VVNTRLTPHILLYTDTGTKQLPLTEGSCWTFGRSEENDFVVPDRWISRNHAMLQLMENGEMYLIDLGSRNGSFVNGRRVSIPVTLKDGDSLTFGQTELEFHFPFNPQAAFLEAKESREFTATATLHVRRLISVVVVDIRDYTVLTRQMDEKILSEMIGNWFRRSGEIIRDSDSWVDKYIGDAVMAVWIHGSSGIEAADMLKVFQAVDALRKMTQQLSADYPVPFPLRIGAGINTGFAMVGNTGSGDRPDYTALGDTVNAAFRLESATKHLGMDVAIGEPTYHHLLPLLANHDFFEQRSVDLKGYDMPTTTYACSFNDLSEFINPDENGEATIGTPGKPS
jgi:adenylate cyclase